MKEKIDATDLESIKVHLKQALSDLQAHSNFARCKQLVIGCSTSEVVGEHIGTAGTLEVAEAIFQTTYQFAKEHNIAIAYQCCEHLNRALVVEASTMERYGYEEVSVVPIRSAGGALATFAYQNLNDAVVVEHIRAEAGIDIGDTFIGMHLKHVAVPVRSKTKSIGQAHVTMAVSRPKLIGGVRANYGDIDR
ncbi:TIGR01440 family protein [Bacillus massiliigorillae]|uniref:TIGR01440 family protein n=1 Tax=Bacillus massiliigorillae TaxID=1243664 RepID=UPI0003A28DAD|nr:TIGR01440 family protein [Bacillus massiliigorillae]